MSLLLAAALTWTLGAEVPVDPYTNIIAAEGYQSSPDVASNGRAALAVWSDNRGCFTRPTVRMTRLHGEYALEPFGVEIAANAGSAHVASDGNDYLVAYTANGIAQAATVEGDRVTRRNAIGAGNVVDVTSDGTTYCVIAGDEYDTVAPTAIVLALDGTILATHVLPARGQAVLPRNGGGYWVVAVVDEFVQLLPVTSSGIGEGKRIRSAAGVTYVAAVTGRNQILLAWRPDARSGFQLLDGNGDPVGAFKLLTYEAAGPPSLAWDGREFLIAWNSGSSGVKGRRVATDGTVLNAFGTAITGEASGFAAAFDGSRTIFLTAEWPPGNRNYSEAPTIRARWIESFAAYTPREGSVITFSGQAQPMVSGASADGTIVALSPQGKGLLRHRDGTVTRVDAGLTNVLYGFSVDSIASAGSVFLVVYTTGINPLTGVAVRCLRGDGTMTAPLVLPAKENAIRPVAATDGKTFLVAWNEAIYDVRGARITLDGTLASTFPIATVSSYVVDLDAAWAGENYVLAWRAQGSSGHSLMRVAADGTPIGAPLFFLGAPDIDPDTTAIAVGTNGDGALVLRAERNCISAIPLARDGSMLRQPRAVLCDQDFGFGRDLDIAWDGSAYTVLWSARFFLNRVLVTRMTRDGTVLALVQDLAPAGTEATAATLLRAGDQLSVLYHRIAPEDPYAGVMRAFLRSVAATDEVRRTRAVRH